MTREERLSAIENKYGVGGQQSGSTQYVQSSYGADTAGTSSAKSKVNYIKNKYNVSSDSGYLDSLYKDFYYFANSAIKDVETKNVFNAADYFEERKKQADALKRRAADLYGQLSSGADLYDQEDYDTMMEYLSTFDTKVDEVLGYYKPIVDAQIGMRAYEDEYKAAMERYAQDQNLQRQAEFAFDLVGPAANFRQMYTGYLGDESYREFTDKWTAQDYYTLGQLQMEDPVKAAEYATQINNYYKNQATEEERKKIREQAVANKGKSTLAALGAGLIGGGDLLDRAAEYAARGTITSKDYVSASDYASETTGAISEDLNNQHGTLNFDPYYDFRQQMSGASTFGMDGNYSTAMGTLDTVTGMFEGKGVGDLYNLGYSVAQNVLNRFTVGAVGGEAAVLASYFMNSATSSIDNAVRKGASGDQAMAIGIITGALEVATEAVPVSELFNIGPATTFRDFLKAVGVESLEEFVGEGLNALGGEIADRFIMGDLSEFETRKRYYMEELGMSEQQAKTKAIMDSVNNILYEGLSGAASGALMGGTESGFQTVGNDLRTNAHYRNTNPQSLIDAAMATGEGSDAFQMAQQMQAQLDAGEKISTRDKKNLGKNVQLMQLAAEKAAAEEELKAIGQTDNLEQVAEIVVKKRRGEELTKKETKAISKNEAVQGLFNVARPTEASTTETQEAAPVEMPSVSDSGKARSITEDADIDVMDFASFDGKNATVKLAGGETVSYDDIMFANQQQANQFYAVRTLPGLDTESANNLLHTIQEANAGQDTTSVVGIRDAYRIGYFNLNEADLAKSDSAVLNPNLRKAIFDIGRQQAKLQAQATPKVRATYVKPSKGYKKVVLEGNIKKLNSKQTAELKVIDFVSNKFAGTAVHVYESYKGEDGNFYYKDSKGVEHNAPNGKYVNGEIWVDLNSGTKGEGLMLNTFAHEMYHHIEEWNKPQANQLAEFVAKELGIEAVDKAVADQMDKARDAGYGEDYFISQGMSEAEAYNEVYARAMSDFVADSLETMFTRGNAADAIARLYGENRTLFDKVKNFIDKWISKIKEFYSDKTISTEGELVAQLENLEELQRLFMEAMNGAGENYRAALDSEPAVAGAEMSNEESFQDSATAVHFQIRPPYADGSKAFNNFVEELNPEARETFDLFYGFYQRSRITNTVSVSGKKVKAVNISALYLLAQDWNNMLAKEPKWAAAAKDLADFLPADVRKRMNMNADGTLNPTTMEKELKMPSSMAQRLVDALPYETIDAEYKLGDKTVTLPQGKARQSVGGEAYRRAILDETRKMFSEGKLKPVGIGTMSKDRWGSLGFLAANGKTGASGDFTTVCPQMMFNRGCWYCYRRAAMEKGVNNKLVANNVWYTGEILRIKDSDIAALNKNGGLRIQSFGDWMPHFSAMLADVLYDAELRGLQVKIITKEPSMINYIAALRDQDIGKNLYFNLSADYTIEKGPAKQAQGGDSLDTVNPERPYMRDTDNTFWWKRAMTVEEAAKYREKYPWVNTRIVATDVKEFIRGLKDNRVDVVTGYHGNIRNWERIDSSTGARKIEVEALGDAGMPRFAFNSKTGEWLTEYEGKNAVHKNLAKEIADNNLQWEYYIKTCCITGRCATCEGKCGALAKDFNTKNATNRDTESVAYWQQQMEYAVEPEFGDLTDTPKFSSRNFAKQVDEVKNNTHDPLNHVYMGTTPVGVANVLDLPKLPMLVTPQHVYSMAVSKAQAQKENRFKKRVNYHDLGWDTVKKLPEYINKPVLIIKSNTDPSDASFVVVTSQRDNDGNPIVAAIKPNGRGNYFNLEFPTNFMLSGYGKDGIQGYVARAKTENRILYANKNSQKKNTPSVQFADNILSSDYTANLTQFKNIVKNKFSGTVFEKGGLPKFSSRDSTGKELTQDQQDFFEESKSRTDDGELVRVYHTSPTAGFTEFAGGKGDGFYRFGDYGDSITYFTDNQKMSSSYAKNPIMVDTKRLTSLEEAKKWTADVSDGYIDIVKSNGAYRVVYSNVDSEILSYKSLTDLFRNLKKDLNTELVGKKWTGMYEGYTNIKNPYVVDAKGKLWNDINVVHSETVSMRSFVENIGKLTSQEKAFLKKLYDTAKVKAAEKGETPSIDILLVSSRDPIKDDVWQKLFANEKVDARAQQWQYLNKAISNDFNTDGFEDEVVIDKTGRYTTNDIVFMALENGSYDGVIIKNVIDYSKFLSKEERADYSKLKPGNLYVTFNSNQFKAADNLHPTEDKDMRYSLRDKRKPLTDREILTQIDPEKRNETERYFLELYQDRLKQISQEEPKLAEIKAQMEALDPVKDKAKLEDLGVDARKIQRNITSLKKKVREAESIEMFKRMVSEERGNQKVQKYKEEQKQKIKDMQLEQRILRAQLKQADTFASVMEEEIARLAKDYEAKKIDLKTMEAKYDKLSREYESAKRRVEKKNETQNVQKQRKHVEENSKKLMKILANPTKDAHVPTALQEPLKKFLDSIDFTSNRQAAGGTATIKDIAYSKALRAVQDAVEGQRTAMSQEDGTFTLDVPSDFIEKIKEHVRMIEDAASGLDTNTNRVYEMTSAELKDLNYILKTINKAIRMIDEFHMQGEKARTSGYAKETEQEMQRRKPVKGEDGNKFVWMNYTPFQAFRAYGKAAQKIFTGLTEGQAKLARTIDSVTKFTEKTYTEKEVRGWERDRNTIKLESGKTVTMSTAQIMTFWCLSHRDNAVSHLQGGGMRMTTLKKFIEGTSVQNEVVQKEHFTLTLADINKINNMLADRKREQEVARKLQQFMQNVGGRLINEISMARWDFMAATEQDYFPMQTDDAGRDTKNPEQERTSLFALLNKSFTKAPVKNAQNALIIDSIFNVFANHMSEVAEYNAFALPLVDAMKWFNYKERVDLGNGQIKDVSVHNSIRNALGRNAERYFIDLMTDINSSQKAGRHEDFFGKILGRSKVASVAWNLRVAIQQISALPRASMVLNSRSLMTGASKFRLKSATEEMMKYSGIALWKSMGYYDLNVARSVERQIKGDTSVIDKFNELGMWLPGKMDERTWARIWIATKDQVRKNTNLSGEALMQATAKLFEDVVYQTQVADSVLTKSSLMRSKSQVLKEATSFMAEPTLSLNILMSAFQDYDETHTMSEKVKRGLMIGFTGYALSAVANVLLSSLWDAWRDDDEYETGWEKYWKAIWGEKFVDGNLFSELNPLEKIAFVKDILSVVRGNEPHSSYSKLMSEAVNLVNAWQNVAEGKGTKTTYGVVYQSLQYLSTVSGVALSNMTREVVDIWNHTFGKLNPDLKLKRYKPDNADELLTAIQKGTEEDVQRVFGRYESQEEAEHALQSAIGEKYRAGELSAEEAQELLDTYFDRDDENEVYWLIDKWNYAIEHGSSDTYTKMGALLDTIENGGDYVAEWQRYLEHGSEMSDIRSAISSKYKKQYIAADDAGREEIRDKLTTVFQDTGLYKNEIQQKFKDWDFEAEYDMSFAEYKAAFRDGEVTENELTKAMKFYGLKQYEIDDTIRDLKKDISFRNKYNMSLTEMKDAYDNGDVAKNTMKQALVYSGMTSNEAQDWIKKRDISNSYGIDYMELDDAYKAGDITRSQLYKAMIEAGSTQREADEAIVAYDWLKKNYKKYPDLAIGDAKKFVIKISDNDEDHTLADYGVTIDHYLEYAKRKPECKGVDANGDGKTDDGTLRDSIFAMIDSLPISDQEKDGLALISYGAKSIRKNAPWHKK